MTTIYAVISAIFLFIAVLFALPALYDYEPTNNGISFKLVGFFVIYNLSYIDIAAIKKIRFGDVGPDFRTLRLGNRFFNQAIFIQLKKNKKSVIGGIVITPKNPDEFIAAFDRYNYSR